MTSRCLVSGLFISTFALLSACATTPKADVTATPSAAASLSPLPKTLEEAVQSPRRTEKNKARDVYRHPQATLEFFDIQPQHAVVEITPGGGWYTEILAPYLAEKGTYVAAMRSTDMTDPSNADMQAWLQKNPDVAAKMNVVEFKPGAGMKLGEPNAADRVLTFRNVHNWMKNKNEAAIFKAFFNVLKPGGILGVVEHRASKNTKRKNGESGYVTEEAIIAMAKKAGFKLVAKSEINANPKDTKDYPEGVWTLPPTLKLGEKDKEKYLAIGESDRMTLKFVKP